MRAFWLGATAAIVTATGAAMSYDGRIHGLGRPNAIDNGGEFRWEIVSGIPNVQLNGPGYFDTFCLELDETVNSVGTYNVNLNTAAVFGGVGGGSPDPINGGTAWLFSSFFHGTLAYYEYAETSTGTSTGGLDGNLNRAQTARALQLAIWQLEDEMTIPGANTAINNLAREYLDQALNSAWYLDGYIGSVRVLNLYTGDHMPAQDVLVIIPLPQAGALAGLGLLALTIRRRRVMS